LECGDTTPLCLQKRAAVRDERKSGVVPPHSKGDSDSELSCVLICVERYLAVSRVRKALAVLILLSATALAREPDGALSLIRTPNNGVPALVLPGEAFEAILADKASLRLAGVVPAPKLALTWSGLPGGRVKARCQVAADTRPGAYALEAVAGNDIDRNVRAVYVLESFPEAYVVAHVSDPHIGSNPHERPSEVIFRDVIQAVNGSEAAFVLISGGLTESGNADQFRRFLEILDTCVAPTFVCPGEHDRKALNYEDTFGPLTYLFRFGDDGYLSFDTKDFVTADPLCRQDADLQIYRRAIKGARWSIGFTHRYEPDMGMRSQIILFVDNPLDLLLYGHVQRSNREGETHVPWGTTRTIITPSAINGSVRMIDVTPRGIRARPAQRVAALR